jgi:hypothetical protein
MTTNEQTDTTRTIAFAGVALVLAGAAYFTQPKSSTTNEDSSANAAFFPDLKLEQIKGLEITDFNPKTAQVDMFRVEYDKGGWTLPLKEGYPADAKDALAKATSWLTTVARDVHATDEKTQHRELGVLNPMDEKGAEGVGILFRALDENKNVVAELVVGKEIEGKNGWRYVRQPKSDAVYRANVSDFSVSTRFRDWIEKDLLELSDGTRTLSSASAADREKYKKNLAMAQWTDFKTDPRQPIAQKVEKKTETLKFTGGTEWAPTAELDGLPPNQETNSEKARELADALKNMQIVDVFAKPAGLGPDLRVQAAKGGQIEVTQAEADKLQELSARGFKPTMDRDVVPISGELRVETKEGVFYRLRFGKLVQLSEDGKTIGAPKDDEADAAPKNDKEKKPAEAKKEDPAKKSEDDKTKDLNRFVLIAVGFDESKFPPVPDAPEPKLPDVKPGEKTDEAARKKQLEDMKQLQKMQTDEARKKRDKDVENGKLRAKELSDRYDRWYYIVSNDTYKKLKIDKATFSKAKEEKKDDKAGAASGFPGIPGDAKNDAPAVNPNIPAPKKDEPKKEEPKKDAAAKDMKPAEKAVPTPPPAKADEKKAPEKAKEAEKPASSDKSKDTGPAKKPPTP